jgi:ABC-2 type transport system ATP-binding protein
VTDAVAYAQLILSGRRDPALLETTLDDVGIARLGALRISRLSGGQRHLAYLAMALAHRPPVLLLDEPTSGLDAEHRMLLRDSVCRLAESMVVITATHLPDDMSRLGGHVVVLRRGEVAFQGDVGQLRELGGPTAGAGGPLDAALVALERGE